MSMTRLQWFEAGHGTTGLELGIVSPDVVIKFIRYRVYQNYRAQKHDHCTSIELAAEEMKCQPWTIREALHFMNGESFRDGIKSSKEKHSRLLTSKK